MRMEDHIWGDDFILQLRMLALVAWVLMAAHVPPRPAVKPAVLHVGYVVRDQIVSQSVPLVDGTPQFARLWIDGQTHRVAYSVCEHAHLRTVGVELENVSTIFLRRSRIGIIDVRGGTHGDEHLLAVWSELNITR